MLPCFSVTGFLRYNFNPLIFLAHGQYESGFILALTAVHSRKSVASVIAVLLIIAPFSISAWRSFVVFVWQEDLQGVNTTFIACFFERLINVNRCFAGWSWSARNACFVNFS